MVELDEEDDEDELEEHPEEDVNDEEVQELMRSEASARTEEQIYEQRRFEATDGDLWISEYLVGYQAKNPHASVEEMTSSLLSESRKSSTINNNVQHQRTDILSLVDEPRTIFNTLKYVPGKTKLLKTRSSHQRRDSKSTKGRDKQFQRQLQVDSQIVNK